MLGICNDHAGVEHKNAIVKHLASRGFEVKNFGTDSTDSIDYTDLAHPLALAVEQAIVEKGIALCGTGNGMAMALNKHQGIRACLAWQKEIGVLVKEHNNANVLVLPARFIDIETSIEIVDAWLNSEFMGGRHLNRIQKIPIK